MATEVSERYRTVSFDRSTKLCHSTTPLNPRRHDISTVQYSTVQYEYDILYTRTVVLYSFVGTQRAPLLVALIFSRRSEFLYEYLYLQVETMVFGPYENSNYSRTHLTLFTVQKSGLCLCVHISHLLCLALACWGRYF